MNALYVRERMMGGAGRVTWGRNSNDQWHKAWQPIGGSYPGWQIWWAPRGPSGDGWLRFPPRHSSVPTLGRSRQRPLQLPQGLTEGPYKTTTCFYIRPCFPNERFHPHFGALFIHIFGKIPPALLRKLKGSRRSSVGFFFKSFWLLDSLRIKLFSKKWNEK